ncbi:MAG TPA: hypothetical protein VEG34_17360 [Thermoanaerobaculia bacterium]|nr:hypothetical protein [Thermoanaerobaculia bacterium]
MISRSTGLAMNPLDDSANNAPIPHLLRRLRPEIEQTFSAFDIAEEEAGKILQEIVFMLTYSWDRIGNRDLWLLTTLRRSCLRRAEERGGPLPS